MFLANVNVSFAYYAVTIVPACILYDSACLFPRLWPSWRGTCIFSATREIW